MVSSKDTPRAAGWKKAEYSAAPPKMEAAKGALKKVVLRSVLAIKRKDYDKSKEEPLVAWERCTAKDDGDSVGRPQTRGIVGDATGHQYLVVKQDGTWGKSFFSLADAYEVNDTEVIPSLYTPADPTPADLPETKAGHKGQGEVPFWAEGPTKGNKCLIEEEDVTRHLASLYTEDGSEMREGDILHIRYEV